MIRTLKISYPPSYGIVKESKEEFESSIFQDVYLDALKNVHNIILSNKNYKSKETISPELLNSVIAFLGERGAGKSSAMCNFSTILKDKEYKWIESVDSEKKGDINKQIEKIKDCTFWALDIIDTAQLGVKETLIGRISAAMYEGFKNNLDFRFPEENKRSFIKNLTEINNFSVKYHNGEWFKSGDAILSDTYEMSIIRSKMSKLVKSYLSFVSKQANIENQYLVICIDDLDMGIKNSYTFMEEIRKFLCIPNVILLITLKIEQVSLVLRANFEAQLNRMMFDNFDKQLIDDLSYKYLEKLIPQSRRIHMPTISCSELNEISLDCKDEISKLVSDSLEPSLPQNMFALKYISNLIWKKTRILLIPSEAREHILLPTNLRSLCQFISFFLSLDDVEENVLDTENLSPILKHNLNRFQNYLIESSESFEDNHLFRDDKELSEVLKSIVININKINFWEVNAYIVSQILLYLSKSDSFYESLFLNKIAHNTKDQNNTVLDVLLDASKHPEYISMGDLMFIVGKIDNSTHCRYIKYLIGVIRILWSIKAMIAKCRTKAAYKKMVGNLIINPDIGFFKDDITDFYYADDSNFEMGVFNTSAVEKDKTLSWREKRDAVFCENINLCHPLALLTHNDFFDKIPFYSFEYMYRFYEILHGTAQRSSIVQKITANNDLDNVSQFNNIASWLYSDSNGAVYDSFKELNEYIHKVITTENISSYVNSTLELMKEKIKLLGLKTIHEFLEEVEKCKNFTSISTLIKNLSEYSFSPAQLKTIKISYDDIKFAQDDNDTIFERQKKNFINKINEAINDTK